MQSQKSLFWNSIKKLTVRRQFNTSEFLLHWQMKSSQVLEVKPIHLFL